VSSVRSTHNRGPNDRRLGSWNRPGLLDALDALIPKLKYRHPHDPSHVSDHILSSLIGTSLSVPVDDGELILGTWQRIILLEFDGPRKRQIALSFVGEI
jgi:secondary thiamine-phosphate synthase enzyme